MYAGGAGGNGDGALEGGGEREAREPRLQRLEAAAVILARYRPRREQRLRDAHHEPQGEQPVAYGPPGCLGGERDEPLLGGRGGPPRPHPGHATSRSTAAATSAGATSARQR